MATRKRFYVYRLFSDSGETLYIGKGSGRRLHNQKRRFAAKGEIVKEFKSEVAAFDYEKRMISQIEPPLNRAAGGGGGWVRRPAPRRTPFEIEFERVGSRRYTARQLLRFDLRPYLDASKIESIRQVADGPRC